MATATPHDMAPARNAQARPVRAVQRRPKLAPSCGPEGLRLPANSVMRPARAPLLVLAVTASLLLMVGQSLGCGAYAVQTDSNFEQVSADRPPALVVTPPQFLFEHPPEQAFQFTWDLVHVLSVERELPVFAPWEYDPAGEMNGRSASESSNGLLSQSDVGLINHLMLDFMISETATDRIVDAPLHMGNDIDASYEREVTIVVTVRSFPANRIVARVQLNFDDEPLTMSATTANPRPMLRDAIEFVANQLADMIQSHWYDGTLGDAPPVELVFNPAPMFDYRDGTGNNLNMVFHEMDELDRLANVWGYYQYFDSDVSMSTVSLFEGAPAGLLVSQLTDTWVLQGVQAGDLIVAVDGVPAAGAQVLYRPFLLNEAGAVVELEILRNGEPRTVRVQTP